MAPSLDGNVSVMMMLDRFPIGDLAVTLLFLNVLSAGLQRALSRRRGVDGKQRELFFEVGPKAGRTRRVVRSTYQRLKSVPTTSAGVFVQRHSLSVLLRTPTSHGLVF